MTEEGKEAILKGVFIQLRNFRIITLHFVLVHKVMNGNSWELK